MGVTTSSQSALPNQYRSFLDWHLSDIRTLIARFEKESNTYGFKVPLSLFTSLLHDLPVRDQPVYQSDADPAPQPTRKHQHVYKQQTHFSYAQQQHAIQTLFNTFIDDPTTTDKLDMLHFITCVILLCCATYQSKIKFFHEFFDFDDDSLLSHFESYNLYKCVAAASCRLLNCQLPSIKTLHRLYDIQLGRFAIYVNNQQYDAHGWNEMAMYNWYVVDMLCRWGTRNSNVVRSNFNSLFLQSRSSHPSSGAATSRDRVHVSNILRLSTREMAVQQHEHEAGEQALQQQPRNDERNDTRSSHSARKLSSRSHTEEKQKDADHKDKVKERPVRSSQRRERRTSKSISPSKRSTSPSARSPSHSASPAPPPLPFPSSSSSSSAAAAAAAASADAESSRALTLQQDADNSDATDSAEGDAAADAQPNSPSNQSSTKTKIHPSLTNLPATTRFQFSSKNTAREIQNLKKLFDDMDLDGHGYLSLEYLKKPKKYTDPFLLRDITSVFQEYKPAASKSNTGGKVEHVTFDEMLDILYNNLTPEQYKLMHSWVPKPINREMVKDIQKIFDRLDNEFTGKVKFHKIMNALKENKNYMKLIEPFSRLRPNRLEVAVNIRELLTALFHKTHAKQLKKILSWAKPTKSLNEEQQNELIRLFSTYDTMNEGRFPLATLREHLIARGLPPQEVDTMFVDIDVQDGMITLQEFLIFYRDMWDQYINFDIHSLRYQWKDDENEMQPSTSRRQASVLSRQDEADINAE